MILWIGLAGCRGAELGEPEVPLDDPHPEVIAALVGHWQCENTSEHLETFTLESDPPAFEIELLRQVGTEGDPDVPFETNCRYRNSGTRFAVEERSGELPWTLRYNVDQFELVADDVNSPACDTFVELQNAEAAADDGLTYHFDFAEPVDDELLTTDWTCARL